MTEHRAIAADTEPDPVRASQPSRPWPPPWHPRAWLPRLLGWLDGERSPGEAATVPPPGGLGIEDLPAELGELPCGVPLALMANDAVGQRVWLPCALADAVATGPVMLIADDPQEVDGWLTREDLAQAHRSGRLIVWMLQTDVRARLRYNGVVSLFKDLAQVGLTPHHAVFVAPVNRLLQGLNLVELQRVTRQWRRWCQTRQRPVVLWVSPQDPTSPHSLANVVRGLCQVFLHVASVGQVEGKTFLYLERWEGSQGPVFDARYGLQHREPGGRLIHDGSLSMGRSQDLTRAPDQFQVITTASVLEGRHEAPSHWTVVDSDAGLLAAAVHAIGATVIVDAGTPDEADGKARLVHALRLNHPRMLRILVRETRGKIRANVEQALLRVGANEVIYKETGFRRMLKFLQESVRQAWDKEVPAHYEQALQGFMPVSARGYQRPSLFCELVRDMVESTQGLGVAHSLVRLQLLPRVPHLDALKACQIKRNGDLLTADENALYVFLFACSESDLADALRRLFVRPLDELMLSQVTDFTDATILQVLKELEAKARLGLIDHSPTLDLLPVAALPVQAPDAAPPLASSGTGDAPLTPAAVRTAVEPVGTGFRPMPIARREGARSPTPEVLR